MKTSQSGTISWLRHTIHFKTVFILIFFLALGSLSAQVNTGGSSNTSNHTKQVIGYITNWDAWKQPSAGVPAQGALTQLNIDYSKYTILNFSFFGVANDGSLHSGDHRNKQIYQPGTVQSPMDLLYYTDLYSSWDIHILYGETENINTINAAVKKRAESYGFQVTVGGNTWSHPGWGVSNAPLPLPLPKEGSGGKGLLELAHQNGVKVMASIGGWSMCRHFPEMAADPVKKARFINDCKKLISMGFDGIDLDWEYPGPFPGMNFTGTNADFANFENLVEEIRAAIGPDKLITAAMAADPKKLDGFNWSRLSSTMDYFNMMTYDFNGGWSNIAGHNAPVYPYDGAEAPDFNWQSTLNKLNSKGVPSNKINFGVPFYGRGVITNGNAALNAPTVKRDVTIQPDGPISTAADYTNWPYEVYDGTPNHFFVKQKTGAGSGWTRHWDNQAKVPYLTKDNFFLSYDDEESIAVKAKFINDNNLAGTIVWTVYGDLEMSGSVQTFGPKLKRWSNVKSPLVNKINEVFAKGGTGNPLPTVSITSPTEGEVFIAGTNITIKANANDSNGSITRVAFYKGTSLLGEDTSAPYEYNWNNVSVGNYSIIAKAYDNEGAVSKDSSVSIIVKNVGDNIPPKVTITAPQSDAVIIAGTTITITADASDSDGTISKVEFLVDGKVVATDASSPYAASWTATLGNHSLTARATDDGNASIISSGINITVGKDSCNDPQYVTSGGGYSGGSRVQNEGNVYECKPYPYEGWCNGSPVAYAPGTGSHWTDAWILIGNCGPVNGTPTVSITAPQSGVNFTTGDVVTINATASDSDGTVTKVEFLVDGSVISTATSSPYTTNWTATEGNHDITAKATDNDGASMVSSVVAITVNSGTNNQPPVIRVTNPSSNSIFTVGNVVTINATASDSDGTVTKVAFLVNGNVIATDTSSPYTTNWTATEGNHSLTARATDNDNVSATSLGINITVEKDSSGPCNDPQYVTSGGGYSGGSRVQNEGNVYECKPYPYEGWCNGSPVAYAPGTGSHWTDAWILIGECGPVNGIPTVSITQPSNGQSFTTGSAITINATASDTDGTIAKVEFFRNGVKLGEDISSPYSYTWNNVADGNYTLTARATDNSNTTGDAAAVNISVGATTPPGPLPARIMSGYWHNFQNGSGLIKLRDVSSNWDVINVSFAEPKISAADGEQGFALSSDFNAINYTEAEFKSDIQILKRQGKKIIISIGGANGQVQLNTASARDKFISSMVAIIKEYDFDGMDIDFEGNSLSFNFGDTDFRNPTTPVIVNTIDAVRGVCNHFGNDFILTMAPETFFVQLGYSFYGGISQGADRRAGAYLPLIHALRDKLTFLQVQYYNSGYITGLDDQYHSMGNSDFYVALVDMLLKGFPITKDQSKFFPALRPDQILVGVPATVNAGGGFVEAPGVINALDYIINGNSYGGQYQLSQTYPGLRGIMSWSVNWDKFENLTFSNAIRAYFDGLRVRDIRMIENNKKPAHDLDIKVFPNPFDELLHIQLPDNLTDTCTITLYNSLGIEVLTYQESTKGINEGTKTFDLNTLESGLYFYKIKLSNQTYLGRVVKE